MSRSFIIFLIKLKTSSLSKIVKFLFIPSLSTFSRMILSPNEWNVPTNTWLPGTSKFNRSLISLAALLVKVIAKT